MYQFLLKRGIKTEARLASLGYTLPAVSTPKGAYVLAVRSGNLIFTAGHIPQPATGNLITGKVGKDLTVEQAAEAAKVCGLAILATLKQELKDLDRIEKIVKLVGFVNCVDGFTQQPQVVNGCSNFFGQVLEDRGIHSRSAVGTNALPLNIPVEIECIVQIKD